MMTKSSDKYLSGLCGGIAESFGIDPTLVRLGWTLLTIFTGFPGVILYAVMALVMPKAGIR